jgi:hypothetical protein
VTYLRQSIVDFPSVASMVAATTHVDGDLVKTLGYYAAGDGGGNSYRYDASSSDTVDGGWVMDGVGGDGTGTGTGRFIAVHQAPTIYSKQWGILCDGATDNSRQLLRLRSVMVSQPETHWNLHFEPGGGSLDYINNRWLCGVKRVTIDMHEIPMRCTEDVNLGARCRWLNAKNHWNLTTDVDSTGVATSPDSNRHTGYKIQSVSANSTTITVVNPGDENNFAAGDRVFVHGLNQQSGFFPPNVRQFEFAEVESVAANTITLSVGLKYDYKDSWKEQTGGLGEIWGAARIINLDGFDHTYTDYFHIKNTTILNGPGIINRGFTNGFIFEAVTAIFENVKNIQRLWCQGHRFCHLIDCEMWEYDIDKNIEHLKMTRCRCLDRGSVTGKLGPASGVRKLEIEDSVIYRPIQVGCRDFEMRNCTVIVNPVSDPGKFGALSLHNNFRVVSVKLFDNHFVLPDTTEYILNNGLTQSLTVGSVSGNDLVFASDAEAFLLDIGTRIWSSGGASVGKITDIDYDGTNHMLQGTWDSPVAGTWSFFTCNDLVMERNTTTTGVYATRFHPVSQTRPRNGIVETEVYLDGRPATILSGAAGVCFKIIVTILRPYTGTLSGYVRVRSNGTEFFRHNLSSIGRYEITPSTTTVIYGATPQTFNALAHTFGQSLDVQLRTGGSPLTGTREEMPELSVVFQFQGQG